MNICYKNYSGDTPKPTPKEDTCMVKCKVIKSGSKGDAVKSWQILLNAWGYSCGIPDGIFGGKTTEATKKFQGDYGLTQDGIVGSKTWGMMLS
jgi:peptidoglycan hydrolase-like protein with peptidoglycan-binding domain